MAHARIIWHLTQHPLLISFIQNNSTTSILLNDRNLAGGGARFALYSPNSRFKVYLGVAMWEHERINDKTHGEITTRIVQQTNQLDVAVRRRIYDQRNRLLSMPCAPFSRLPEETLPSV